MPAKSKAQEKLMKAVAHSPKFAKKVGIPVIEINTIKDSAIRERVVRVLQDCKVGKEFIKPVKKKK